jgi:hypothetical protein
VRLLIELLLASWVFVMIAFGALLLIDAVRHR